MRDEQLRRMLNMQPALLERLPTVPPVQHTTEVRWLVITRDRPVGLQTVRAVPQTARVTMRKPIIRHLRTRTALMDGPKFVAGVLTFVILKLPGAIQA